MREVLLQSIHSVETIIHFGLYAFRLTTFLEMGACALQPTYFAQTQENAARIKFDIRRKHPWLSPLPQWDKKNDIFPKYQLYDFSTVTLNPRHKATKDSEQ